MNAFGHFKVLFWLLYVSLQSISSGLKLLLRVLETFYSFFIFVPKVNI